MFAARYSSVEVVKILLDAGADVNATNKEGNTALVFSERERRKHVAGQNRVAA